MVSMKQLIAMFHTALRNKTIFDCGKPEVSPVSLFHQLKGAEFTDGAASDPLFIEEDLLVALHLLQSRRGTRLNPVEYQHVHITPLIPQSLLGQKQLFCEPSIGGQQDASLPTLQEPTISILPENG